MSEDVKLEEGAADAALTRWALCVEYVGTHYHGWQVQKNGGVASVQGMVEKALSSIANEPISVVCAGRTDSCVNATYQIIHFDTRAERDERGWIYGTNTRLPDDIAIRWAVPVSADFHARFSARERRYRYLIYSAPVRPALLGKGVTWTHRTLDVGRMNRAAHHLIGEHDFTSYRAVGCQAKSPVREVRRLDVYKSGHLIVIDVTANAFLHHMVRNIAGVLMKVGCGDAGPDWAREVLEARDRRQGGVTAPPFGLYFVDVKYPEEFDLPASEIGPYFLQALD
ncbi:tRNA pseudouridine(38-40) synthase TruA [Marinobacterium jannaschii]|uniref:tRNA pseudouridine(38-40) synthase TruA n=1 Tax=Marinobacterium jannaschii TaxID=64970 RepID=UPI000489FCB6|nr:tRNA pseudouridine(38-40) synthase TruA [Marinobacterium jannaschii]